jgi:hypothetical protein
MRSAKRSSRAIAIAKHHINSIMGGFDETRRNTFGHSTQTSDNYASAFYSTRSYPMASPTGSYIDDRQHFQLHHYSRQSQPSPPTPSLLSQHSENSNSTDVPDINELIVMTTGDEHNYCRYEVSVIGLQDVQVKG